MGHIRLAREADLILVAPATANLMARAANGLADDLATTILLATTAPVLMAPAMNPAMWSHPATQENLARLQARGITFVGPGAGDMACGDEGTGRLSEPDLIVDAALAHLARGDGPLAGRHAIVTSGPTVEPIDDVRFIANRSSGKQGHAIAAALAGRGMRVTLVSGLSPALPPQANLVPVQTAREMLAACEAALPADLAICAAAVADWRQRCDDRQDQEVRKQRAAIARTDGKSGHTPSSVTPRIPPCLVIGFAAEAERLRENAMAKLARKGCDWIVGNAVTTTDGSSVFGSDSNSAMLITGNDCDSWPVMSKQALAERLADRIEAQFA